MLGFQGIRRPPLRHAELVDLMGHDQYGSRPSYRRCRCERPSAVGLVTLPVSPAPVNPDCVG